LITEERERGKFNWNLNRQILHHIFSEDELRVEFDKFQSLEISPRDEGRVTALWIKK
jgi:hypothetical protein